MTSINRRLYLRSKKELFYSCEGSRERQTLLKVSVYEDAFASKVIEVQESPILRDGEFNIASKTIETAGYKKNYDRFNSGVTILDLGGIAGTDYISYFLKEFWISEDFKRLITISPETGHYIDWVEKVVIEDFDPKDESFIRLKTAFMSPSQEKACEVTCLSWDGNKRRLERSLNKATKGMYEVLKANGKNLTYTKLVKLGARMAQGLAPSANMKNYNLSSAAIILSKDARAFADGGGYFKEKKGFPIGLGAQMRNFGPDKWFGLCIDPKTINDLTLHYGPVVYVEREIKDGNVTREQVQKYLEQAFEGEGPWAEKTVVLGAEHGAPDLLMDLNIVKCSTDFSSLFPTGLKVLDLAGPTSGDKIVLGSQMCFSLLLSQEGRDLMQELLLETIAEAIVPNSKENQKDCKLLCNLLKDIRTASKEDKAALKQESNIVVERILSRYYSMRPRILSFDEFEEGLSYSTGLIDSINPSWARSMDQGTKRSIEKALANKMAKTLSEFQPEVEGKFCRVLADPSAEFSLNLLADDEVCSPSLPEKEVVGIRSPKAGVFEQGIYKNISVKEILNRINKLSLNNRNKRTLRGLYNALRRGSNIAFVPASSEIKLLHSGMDFDFDGMTEITDQRIVKVLKKYPPVIVKVTDEGNTSEDDTRFDFDMNYIEVLIKQQFNNGNLPIGIVCNHNHTWVMMLGDLKLARKVLAYQFGGGNATEYVGLEYQPINFNRLLVEIDSKKTNNILEELHCLDYDKLDDKTTTRILKDINVIMNRYIQKTIDASKSGEVITIPDELLINEVVQTASLSGVDFNLYSKTPKYYDSVVENKLAVKINKAGTTYIPVQVRDKKKFLFNDVYHQVRTDVARVATRLLMELVKKEARIDETTVLARDRVKFNLKEFIEYKSIFGDVNAHKINISKGVCNEELANINADFRDTLSYLGNTIRLATPSMTPEERVLAAIKVATDTRKSVNACASMFPSATLPWEYLLLVSQHEAGIDFVGEPIKYIETLNLQDGEEIRVINKSIAAEGFIDVPDGLYIVREHDNKFYATKSIKELVAPLLVTDNKLIVRLKYNQDFETISKELDGEEIKISTYKYGVSKDCVNGKYEIVLPSGKSGYSKVVNNTTSSTKKQVLSTTNNAEGSSIRQMFLCLEASSNINISERTSAVKLEPAVNIDSKKAVQVRKARAAYEALSVEQKAIFPADKLAKLEALEAELIDIEEVKDVENVFDLL